MMKNRIDDEITRQDERFMNLAVSLARKHRPSPNPRVGAVIVKDGEIVGRGVHAHAGGPHAEVVALVDAGGQASGADMYVTLEPCSHHGRTPPCVDSIIKAGVRRVVFGCADPNPLVDGSGAEKLRKAGILVNSGAKYLECERLAAGHIKFIRRGLPYVIWKYAMTLDGKVATVTGQSKWITGEKARREVHKMRRDADAVLVGVGTVKADNPELTVRGIRAKQQPFRVIFDSHASLLPDSLVFKPADGKTIVFISESAPPENRAALVKAGGNVVVAGANHVDLTWALQILARDFDVREVLLECGPELAAGMIEENLVDEIACFISGKLFGGSAPGPLGGEGVRLPNHAKAAPIRRVRRIGEDLLITAVPV